MIALLLSLLAFLTLACGGASFDQAETTTTTSGGAGGERCGRLCGVEGGAAGLGGAGAGGAGGEAGQAGSGPPAGAAGAPSSGGSPSSAGQAGAGGIAGQLGGGQGGEPAQAGASSGGAGAGGEPAAGAAGQPDACSFPGPLPSFLLEAVKSDTTCEGKEPWAWLVGPSDKPGTLTLSIDAGGDVAPPAPWQLGKGPGHYAVTYEKIANCPCPKVSLAGCYLKAVLSFEVVNPSGKPAATLVEELSFIVDFRPDASAPMGGMGLHFLPNTTCGGGYVLKATLL